MTRAPVRPELLRWARERARLSTLDLEARFPKLAEWERGEKSPTLKQLDAYARATRAPLGYLFLQEPPEERLPIPDFRTMAGRNVVRPTPDLLDTIYLCQGRQSWYQEFAEQTGQDPLAFVGSTTFRRSPVEVAAEMSHTLGFDLDARHACPTWTEALRLFIGQADRAGVLVMVSGVVQNNNTRRLDPAEFRGFALVDRLAPLVFINGADSKSAQMFTLAHELAHLWLGESALSDTTVASTHQNAVETWCNRVAAELLTPLDVVRTELVPREPLDRTVPRLTRRFKVSTLVVLRRLLDARHLSRQAFNRAYEHELERLAERPRSSGGDFYLTTAARVSRRFARALLESTLEGRTLYRDAFHMLGISKVETFNELGRSLNFQI
ncbi:MAG: DNA-binding protein [Betaproteobacteria bacterium RIFCSPLOWO2_12_FULL_66_14]|nr:MAG: DNA-binding protein [Betaproteobacteria bacterium RIFCSPLOWO2_12_FULL_66_14]